MNTDIARGRLGLDVAVITSSGETRAVSGGNCCPRRLRSTLGGHRGCRGTLNVHTNCTAINADGLSTPTNVSETANLPAGGAVLRTNEPERPKNQSDTSDVRTDTQNIANNLKTRQKWSGTPKTTTEAKI